MPQFAHILSVKGKMLAFLFYYAFADYLVQKKRNIILYCTART